ncbi:MAG: DUF5667 domain-containing protein [bacterium]
MKDKEIKKRISEIHTVRMTPTEKSLLFERISENIGNVPSPYMHRSFFGRLFHPKSPWVLYATIALCGVAFVSGGSMVMAENSLPGDVLYSVKINVSEPLRDSFIFNEMDRARWEVEKTKRRLQEAEELASQGKFVVDDATNLKENINDSMEDFSLHIKNAEQAGIPDAVIAARLDYEAAIEAHSKILENMHNIGSSTPQGGVLGTFYRDISGMADEVSQTRKTDEESVLKTNKVSIDDIQKTLVEDINTTRNILSQNPSYDQGYVEVISSLLGEAEAEIGQAIDKNNSGQMEDAYSILNDAACDIKEAHIILDQAPKVGINNIPSMAVSTSTQIQ